MQSIHIFKKEGKMSKQILFLLLSSLFFISFNNRTQAQWEEAKVQRLTYNTSPNYMLGLCIDNNDKLFLFYEQCKIDPHVQPYRDTLFLMTKEKGGEWSQPERISTRPNLEVACNKFVGYDPYTDLIHLFYNCPDDTLYYTNSSIPNWEVVKTDSGSNRPHPSAMAFDTLGNIHLVWQVYFDSLGHHWYRVMYSNNSTGRWVNQQVAPPIFLGYGGAYGSYLAVQKNGSAHIMYQGAVTEGMPYYYIRNDSLNSQNWHLDTIPRPPRLLYYYICGSLKIDLNEKLHLLTFGCTEEDCVWPGLQRRFYYYKQAEDSVWIGPEQIPDTMFGSLAGMTQLLVDEEGVPYASYGVNPGRVYFTDRKQGAWRVLYPLVDWVEDPDSVIGGSFCFVLDSEGRGHGVFKGSLFWFMAQDDSLEIFYFRSPLSKVEDTSEEQGRFWFELFQNYPNPFNAVTRIQYRVGSSQNHPIHTTLKIYNILGEEVRELVNKSQNRGNYEVSWDGKNNSGKEVTSGIYLYQLEAGDYKEIRKLVLIK
jgi:hypothetical protein